MCLISAGGWLDTVSTDVYRETGYNAVSGYITAL
jgi:hypothetical protein